MPGVPNELIEHALKFDPKATPKKQRLRRFSPKKWQAIKMELAKLLVAGFIKEVFHPQWLANPVLIDSIGIVPRILSPCRELIKSSTLLPAAFCFPSLIVTPATIRLPLRKKNRSRLCSSPRSAHTLTKLCPSD